MADSHSSTTTISNTNKGSQQSPLLDLTYVNRQLDLHNRNSGNGPFPSHVGLAPNSEWQTQEGILTPETNTLPKLPNIRNTKHWRRCYDKTMYQDIYNDKRSNDLPASTSFFSSIFPRVVVRRRIEIILVSLLAIMVAIATFCATALATAATQVTSTGSTVNLSYGQYQGNALPSNVTEFLGVRFAAPAVRFSAPQPPQAFEGVHIADTKGPGCKGSGSWGTTDTEDCLFADIFAPTGATSKSKLPVYVFIQGGGLTNAVAHFNGTSLIQTANKNELVVVSFAYRTGPFGFLASKEIQQGGNLNVGYLDQHRLLQWVNKEITQFGGDPTHVTIGGQSAGAGSVVSQLTAYGGIDRGLFQAALIESPSMPPVRNVTDQQYQYDNIVQNAGCQNETDTLACLRSKSASDITKAAVPAPFPGANGAPVYQWVPTIDGDFVRDLPVAAMARGNFIKVPTVFGGVTSEGSIFTPRSISDESSARRFIHNNWPTVSSTELDQYTKMYNFDDTRDDPNWWQRAAQAYGETRYTCPGQHLSNIVAQQPGMANKVWNWRYNVATQSQKSSGNGVSHGSELSAVWGGSSGQTHQLLASTEGVSNIVNHIQDYWISFAQTYDPNARKAASAPEWAQWNGQNRVLFNLNGTTMETVDQAQLNRCGYLAQITIGLKQ